MISTFCYMLHTFLLPMYLLYKYYQNNIKANWRKGNTIKGIGLKSGFLEWEVYGQTKDSGGTVMGVVGKHSSFMQSRVLTNLEDWISRREGLECIGEFSCNSVGNRGPCSGRKGGQSCTCWMSSKAWQGMKPTWAKRKRRGSCSWQDWHRALLREDKGWDGSKSWREEGHSAK